MVLSTQSFILGSFPVYRGRVWVLLVSFSPSLGGWSFSPKELDLMVQSSRRTSLLSHSRFPSRKGGVCVYRTNVFRVPVTLRCISNFRFPKGLLTETLGKLTRDGLRTILPVSFLCPFRYKCTFGRSSGLCTIFGNST